MFPPYRGNPGASANASGHSSETTYTNTQATSSAISLPPIVNMIDPSGQASAGMPHQTYGMPPPGPSSRLYLPPPAGYPYMQSIPPGPQDVTTAPPPFLESTVPYPPPFDGRIPLPPSPIGYGGISVIPPRNPGKTKEVKRRTKTGCMTCRRRRIKVSGHFFRSARARFSNSKSICSVKVAGGCRARQLYSTKKPRGQTHTIGPRMRMQAHASCAGWSRLA